MMQEELRKGHFFFKSFNLLETQSAAAYPVASGGLCIVFKDLQQKWPITIRPGP